MEYRLRILREASWRGSILDTLTPIADLELTQPDHQAGILRAEYELTLTNGKTVTVGCGWSSSAGFGIGIYDTTKRATSVSSASPMHMELVMQDGNVYVFEVKQVGVA